MNRRSRSRGGTMNRRRSRTRGRRVAGMRRFLANTFSWRLNSRTNATARFDSKLVQPWIIIKIRENCTIICPDYAVQCIKNNICVHRRVFILDASRRSIRAWRINRASRVIVCKIIGTFLA